MGEAISYKGTRTLDTGVSATGPVEVSDTTPMPVKLKTSAGVDLPAGTVADPVYTSVGKGVALTDASIANASGASETIAAASATRTKLIVANPSASVSWWINPSGGVAAANTAGSFELPPGAVWTPNPAPTNVVKGIATVNTDLTVAVG